MVNLELFYILIYILSDIIITIVLSALNHIPGEVIITALIIKLFILPTTNITIIFFVKKIIKSDIKTIFISFLITYFMIFVFIFLIKPGDNKFITLFIDIHKNLFLYTFICIPYIISSIIAFLIWRFNLEKDS